jgi:nucleotide-binding universal stress UspA family protein
MSYKTILVHVDNSKHCAMRVAIAAKLAIAENAHLVGGAMTGVSRFLYRDKTVFLEPEIKSLNECARKSLTAFDALASAEGVLSYEHRLIDDDIEGGLVLQARYSDLVVVGQIDLNERNPYLVSDLPEYVMLNSARPVLVIPYAGQFDQVGKNVMIAWDGGFEATRAITAAIPLLKRADTVTVALFNPGAQRDLRGEEPGADIALYLARHGVNVDLVHENTSLDIGNAMLSLAADKGIDLIVMGGYGHTRFHEVLLGGVTKTLLESMTVPVFMMH